MKQTASDRLARVRSGCGTGAGSGFGFGERRRGSPLPGPCGRSFEGAATVEDTVLRDADCTAPYADGSPPPPGGNE
ncbi:hypothetical protein GCM10010420_25590 [Streptomyces glaucosporus]|uniref:Uncharacterized protein n=1 Tax=Streptomyces glaucosporus TaxID=284044 RepID=A0ABP5VD94_9ACTN